MTPEQAAALLAESNDNDLLAFHAIGLFAGLRVAEIKALDCVTSILLEGLSMWGRGFQKLVPADSCQFSKTCDMVATDRQTLGTRSTRYRHEGARQRAGITEWPDNAMRHSFVSYRLERAADCS